MKVCKKCCTEFNDEFSVCPKCGELIEEEKQENIEETKEQIDVEKEEIQVIEEEKPIENKAKLYDSIVENNKSAYQKFFASPLVLALCIAVTFNSVLTLINLLSSRSSGMSGMSGIITIITFGAIEIMLHVFLVVGVWIVYAKSKMKKPLNCSSLIRPAVKAKNIGIILSLIIATLLGIISCIMCLIKYNDVETYFEGWMVVNMIMAFAFPLYITFFKSLLEFLKNINMGLKNGIKYRGKSAIFAAVMLFVMGAGSLLFLITFGGKLMDKIVYYMDMDLYSFIPMLFMILTPFGAAKFQFIFEALLMIYAGIVFIFFQKKVK